MKISAIIPVFNGESFISEAAGSLVNQTLAPYEVILIDDRSTDRSAEIAKSLSVKYPSVKNYKNESTKGISGAVNTGISKSLGDLIVFMDQDDISLPDRLLKQHDLLKNAPSISVCGTWMQEFGESTDIWKYPINDADIKSLLLLHSPIANPTVMIRKEVFESNNIYYRSDYDLAQDFDFWVRIFPYIKFAVIPEVLVKYRTHPENSSKTRSNEQYQAWKEAIRPLINKLGIAMDDEMYLTLYNLKYPHFKETYKRDGDRVDSLIGLLLEANNSKKIFDQDSLSRMFLNKINAWVA